MHAGLVDQDPGGHRQWQQHPPGSDATLDEDGERGQRQQGQRQRAEGQVVGVEDGDDGDSEQVIDHREGKQEGAQRGRQARSQDREDGERESDIGCGRNRPPGQVALRAAEDAAVEPGVDQRWDSHTPDGRGHWDGSPPGVAEVAGNELAFELEAGHEEEDGQKAICGPGAQREVQVQERRADHGVAQRPVPIGPRGVRPDQSDGGGGEQEQATDGLAPEDRRNALRLGPGTPAQQHSRRAGGHIHPFTLLGREGGRAGLGQKA